MSLAGLGWLVACGGGGDGGASDARSSVDERFFSTPSGETVKVVTVARGLSHPWSLTFMPDGRMLVTERAGAMRLVSANGTISAPISGLPPVVAGGQGGLLDVQLPPDYAASPWVYWAYSEAGTGTDADKAGTAVARGQLVGAGMTNAMTNVQVIFRQSPKVTGTEHFGSRLAFAPDGTLFVTLGERHQDDPAAPGLDHAQNVTNHLGKVVRIQRDGGLPMGNPSFGSPEAKPELWSIGHRNPQGAAIHPETGELWLTEHGPQGGDELNRILPGRNYGWPVRSYGCPYGAPPGEACRVNGGTHAPDFEEPLTYWVPISIAPSGMAFYTGTRHPQWRGNLFLGALSGQALWRLTLNGNTVTQREALFTGELGRIRDVRQGPDGWLYLLTDSDNGLILRIER
ncbi:MAG: PQQ-dependent sugar dehydrogenase [Pseudomonadota bacterium]